MNRNSLLRFSPLLLTFALVTLVAAPAAAQSGAKDPHLAYAFPAGFQRGQSCEIVLGGQYLQDVKEAFVAGDGVKLEVVKWYRPMTRGEYNGLRMKLDDTRTKLMEQGNATPTEAEVVAAAGITEEQLREMEIHRVRDRDSKRQPNEQLEEELTVQVTVADDAPLGKRELRLMSEGTISNPLWIHVGQWAEVREAEPNDTTPDPVIKQFPIVVNGQIMPGDVDTFSFDAKRGMKLVVVASARDVIPYLADAVPGWFQASLVLTDSDGKEVAFAGSFQFSQDPVLYCEVPRDGRYTVKINDSLYRGREDFVYRLTLGEIPFVTSIFPLGAQWDEETPIQLEGWNLTQATLLTKKVTFRQFRPVRWYVVPQGTGQEVNIPVQMDLLTEVLEQEPNNDQATAQDISTRTIVNGRIDAPGDEDVFHITGGGRVAIEVHSRRHGSPLDSRVTLTDMRGQEIGFNDDFEDKTQSLLTHHADSHLVAIIPPTGAYLHLSDTQDGGGPNFVYRLHLRAPKPDFELRVTPATIIGRSGAIVPITVHAMRQDNFAEDIEVMLVEPPPGFALSGNIIPGNADRVTMTLSLPAQAPKEPIVLEMNGRARGRSSSAWVVRPAVPAENMMQAFAWTHLIPVENWTVIVSGSPNPKPPFDIAVTSPTIALPRGGEVYLPVRAAAENIDLNELHVELTEPKGVTADIISDGMGSFAIQLVMDPEKTVPGQRGNLIFNAHRIVTPEKTKDNPNPKPRRTNYGSFPAVPFEIGTQTPKVPRKSSATTKSPAKRDAQ